MEQCGLCGKWHDVCGVDLGGEGGAPQLDQSAFEGLRLVPELWWTAKLFDNSSIVHDAPHCILSRDEPVNIDMSLYTHLPRPRPYVCRQCILRHRTIPIAKRSINKWAAEKPDAEEQWKEQSMRIRAGQQPSMLQILEDRGFVKDVAGCVFLNLQRWRGICLYNL